MIVVARLGLEPRLTGPEPVVLPLDDLAIIKLSTQQSYYAKNKRISNGSDSLLPYLTRALAALIKAVNSGCGDSGLAKNSGWN